MHNEKEIIKKTVLKQVEKNNISTKEAEQMMTKFDTAKLLTNTLSYDELTHLIDNADEAKKQKLMAIIKSIE